MYKVISLIIIMTLTSATYAQQRQVQSAYNALNRRVETRVSNATIKHTPSQTKASSPHMSVDPKDPRLITLNGQVFHLREGAEEFVGLVNGQNGCSYSKGNVSIRTYKDENGNTITACFHHPLSKDMELSPSIGLQDHTRKIHNHPLNGKLTASEHPTGKGSHMDAYEIRNKDGSYIYIVRKAAIVKGQVNMITVKQKIPAEANLAEAKGRTYQAVRNADFVKIFGKTIDNLQYKGTFGPETYYRP